MLNSVIDTTAKLDNFTNFSTDENFVDTNHNLSSIGRVINLKDGIITVIGLQGVKAGEIVYISTSLNNEYIKALVLNLNVENVNAILLGSERLVSEGSSVKRSESLLKINSGLRLFGRVCNSLGEFKTVSERDNSEFLRYFNERRGLVEKKATGIVDRISVSIPLRTGIKAVDSLVPIGRGQRELIIGDKQTGKTSVAIDSILNHTSINNYIDLIKDKKDLRDLRNVTWFVYSSVGQKQSTVANIVRTLEDYNAFWYTSVVSATAAEPAPLQFLSPYTACAVGEFVRDVLGGHCVVIYDDLSKHAVAYRQMSLLLRRPPGREAFPGDVFYVHSRLLERAGSLRNKIIKIRKTFNTLCDLDYKHTQQTRGTLTAFPIIETQAGDVSAYIPTNVISITDGQIFLEAELFYRGVRPAINVGLSVSRVGSAAQPPLMKRVSGSLKMELAQYREIEGFSKLGANLDEHTQRLLTRGQNIIEMLKQDVFSPISTFGQSLSIFVGIGYSTSWLGEIVKIKKIYKDQLLNTDRIKLSWLELFRLKSNNQFTLSDIKLFLSSILDYSKKIGIGDFMKNVVVENFTNVLISKCPFVFFDDIMYNYILERGQTTVDNSGKIFLESFVLFDRKKIIKIRTSTSFEDVDYNSNNNKFFYVKAIFQNLKNSFNCQICSIVNLYNRISNDEISCYLDSTSHSDKNYYFFNKSEIRGNRLKIEWFTKFIFKPLHSYNCNL